jgi:hypothetical protein
MKARHHKGHIRTYKKSKKEIRLGKKRKSDFLHPQENKNGRSASLKNVCIVNGMFKSSYGRRVSKFWKYDSCKVNEL